MYAYTKIPFIDYPVVSQEASEPNVSSVASLEQVFSFRTDLPLRSSIW